LAKDKKERKGSRKQRPWRGKNESNPLLATTSGRVDINGNPNSFGNRKQPVLHDIQHRKNEKFAGRREKIGMGRFAQKQPGFIEIRGNLPIAGFTGLNNNCTWKGDWEMILKCDLEL